MLPHRYLQSGQFGEATPSGSIDTIVDKMAHSAIDDTVCPPAGTSYNAADQTTQKSMKFGVDDDMNEKMDVTPNENESADGSMVVAKDDNLEYLPIHILMEIFNQTDDIGLMHLAEISNRFANITKTAVINGEELGGDPDAYLAKWNCSGSEKQVMYIKHIDDIRDRWAMEILQSQHINHIKKLTFDSCTFSMYNNFEESLVKIFTEPLASNLTHFVIRHHCCDCYKQVEGKYVPMIDLSDCRNLKKLEIHGANGQSFWWKPLRQVIQNNPAMQSLLLYDLKIMYASLWKIIPKIAAHLNQINELALMMDSTWSQDSEQIDYQVFKSFVHLKSLSLSVNPNTMPLLHYFGTQCKQLKHLGLRIHDASAYSLDEWKNVLIGVAHSFQQIESFRNYSYESIKNDIEPLVELLPNLRHLSIEPSYQNDIECSDALPLLQKCPSLQKITIVFKYACDGYPETLISATFFNEFINTVTITGKINACIEIEERDRIIGSVTTNGIIWRNKLMYWVDCDKNYSFRNTQLLDLAEHLEKHEDAKNATDRINLLDRIFDYLDVGSLYSFAETNEECKQLVKSHVKRRGTCIISDEFQPFESLDFWNIFNELEFIQYATNLHVETIRSESKNEIIDAIHSLEHLEKLSIYDEHPEEDWPSVKLNISHVVYDASHFMDFKELFHIVKHFPDAKTIEFKKAGLFKNTNDPALYELLDGDEWPNRWDSKKFIFNYRGQTQMANLLDIFQNLNLQLIPIFPKKN